MSKEICLICHGYLKYYCPTCALIKYAGQIDKACEAERNRVLKAVEDEREAIIDDLTKGIIRRNDFMDAVRKRLEGK